eukprot:NODE_1392_length_1753_cov_175.844785_g1323_i0.p1 GENE.NODE_1392_length_1753_cov_175.844785_g1323_i0~~NODE_1392_length_1753_cov_175.844785_g1323_i0.p1  ORF type:complete len:580 (-),score=92.44 NODE_1392_length_1753_cov_175.844785_g1323_i0:13-1707(-)
MSMWENLQSVAELCVNRWVPQQCSIPVKNKPRATVLPQNDPNQTARDKELASSYRLFPLQIMWVGLPPACRQVGSSDLHLSPSYAQPWVKKPRDDGPWEAFTTLERMYHMNRMRLPPMSKIWTDDAEFGRQRLVGLHPAGIEVVKRLPPHLRVTEEMVGGLLDDGTTLSDAIRDQRIMMVDYSEKLKDIPLKRGGFLAAPICLLYLTSQGTVVPLAIQLWSATATADAVVITPDDNLYAWQLAKMHFQSAECHWHFFGVKVLQLYQLGALFATTTFKCLSIRHPIRQLLAPCLHGALACNNWLSEFVLNQGGMADQLFSSGLDGGLVIARRAYKQYIFSNNTFHGDITNRGMDGPTRAGAGYYYAEDGKLVWEAMSKYVRAVVELYYQSPADITNDKELYAWAIQLKEYIPSVPYLQEYTVDPIVNICSTIMWAMTAGQSASTNDAYNMIGWVPNQPFGLSLPWPMKPRDQMTERDVLNSLPSKAETLGQAQFVSQLMNERLACTPLREEISQGGGAGTVFPDSNAQGLHLTFMERLADIQAVIEQRNSKRPIPYSALIPQSTG